MPTTVTNIQLQASKPEWTDTGITLAPGDHVGITISGTVVWDGQNDHPAYPEGIYSTREPTPDHALEPNNVVNYGEDPIPQVNDFVVINTKPFSVALVMRAPGVTPSNEAGAVSDAYYPMRANAYENATQNPVKVWLLFNDVPGGFGNNTGSFGIQLEHIPLDGEAAYEPTCDHSIGRFIHAQMKASLRRNTSQYAYMWAIEPSDAPPEGYTSLDCDFDFPAVTDGQDVMVPALRYQSEGSVAPSELPSNTGMSDDTVDISRGLPLDSPMRSRINSEAYRDAKVTIMVALPWLPDVQPTILFSGKIGKGKLDDVVAQFELHPWSNLLNRPILRVITPHCDCELFARGRCAGNGEDPDAPQITDPGRTAIATVTAVVDACEFTISVNGKADGWANFGRVRFTDGDNAGVRPRTVKKFLSTGKVVLHNELPYVPQVGDAVVIEEGCERTWAACQAKQNTNNFQGFPFVPGRQNLVKRYG